MFRMEPLRVGDNLFQRGRLLVRKVSGQRGVPAFVLLLSLVPVFLFGPNYGYFFYDSESKYRKRDLLDHEMELLEHDNITRHHMLVAVNLAAEHNFLGFYRQMLTPEGERTYFVYNRFPVVGHALIKLVTLPFSDNLSSRLRAARLLMLVFFVGAAMLAYLSLSRLTSSRWAALGTTLLAFASWQSLFFCDMVATQGAMDLFGSMLILHGMAVFCAPAAADGEREVSVPVGGSSGFGPLLVKTCAALLLGWHGYGLVLPFVGLGLAGALGRGRIDWRRIRRHLTLGTVALVFGVIVLGFNLAREYFALGDGRPLVELPTVSSMLARMGIDQFTATGDWAWGWTGSALLGQFHLVGLASAPYALITFLPWTASVALGIAVSLSTFGLISLRSSPYRLPLAALALSGFCWALPMSQAVLYHTHYSRLYVGIPMVFFSLVLLRLPVFVTRPSRRMWGVGGYVVVAMASFALSSWGIGEVKREAQDVEVERTRTTDMEAIRRWVKNKVVYITPQLQLGEYSRLLYSLTGSVIIEHDRVFSDFVIGPRLDGVDSLTPENRWMFLYRPAAYNAVMDAALHVTRARYEQAAQIGTLSIESDYNIYHIGRELLYVGEDQACMSAASPWFFLHIYPVHADSLPHNRRRYGFDNLDFSRDERWQQGGRCYAVAELPGYEIAEISTGQYVKNPDGSFHVLWKARYAPPVVEAEKQSKAPSSTR